MAKLDLLLLSFLSLGASALTTGLLGPRVCGQAVGPSSILSISKENRDEPAKAYDPYVALNQLVDGAGNKVGVAAILRFTPPAPGSGSSASSPPAVCEFTLSFPASRFGDVQLGRADWQKPPEIAISKITNLGAPGAPLPSYNQLNVVPGPWATATVSRGLHVVAGAEPYDAAADYLLEIPDWIAVNMGVSWPNDVLPAAGDAGADADEFLGVYLRHVC
ncbi:hypothetical protein B0T24DRAFT_682351 [Lasiosphaeria ovina]|uniref:Uncharacterized protein n=1 Tax=Lasiosphaeria ovina TaxID=92902 RepID=A0AAE0N200_9PEZI|nr:hypothetical protein B0T24DRAFT_682351 [Lasiosphaeria ovina]